LRDKRRLAIVISFVVAMFLTPPDPMSQLLMAIPLCLLYELSIWAVWLRERVR
jgi:sec-independent protein translocase protein TatC